MLGNLNAKAALKNRNLVSKKWLKLNLVLIAHDYPAELHLDTSRTEIIMPVQ